MKKWKILIPSLVATAGMQLVSFVGCNNTALEYEVTGGNTELVGYLWEKGSDNQAWDFKVKGVSMQADSMEIVPVGTTTIDGISLVNQQIQWKAWMPAGTYQFKVKVKYGDLSILSNTVTLVISKLNFNECSWEHVGILSEKYEKGELTLDQFCQCFTVSDLQNPKHQIQPTSFNDFIGQTRFIKVNGANHQAIVIDYQRDEIASSGTKALFTFQFNHLISDSLGYSCEYVWSGTGFHDYWNAELNAYLNDTTIKQIKSVYEILQEEEKDLSLIIKPVKRTVTMYNTETNSWFSDQRQTYLFEPTISNIFSSTGIRATTDPLIIDPTYVDLYCAEGQPHSNAENPQYAYFRNDILDQPVDFNNWHASLIHPDLRDNFNVYWLSTPHISAYEAQSKGRVFIVNVDGKLKANTPINQFGIAPCFCI